MREPKLVLEACVETLDAAIQAARNGADRIELCSDLSVGGITPSEELTIATLDALKIPIMAMVRPRGGDFVYDEAEFETMKKNVVFFKKLGVMGVVFGILKRNGEVDLPRTAELAALASPMQVTFHKAIDETPNLLGALNSIMQVPGIQRVLTSGGKPTALEGASVLREMVQASKGRLTILAAGKVTSENLKQVHAAIGTTEYHGKKIMG